MEVLIIPALYDLAVLAAVLIAEYKQASIMTRMEESMLTKEEAANVRQEIEVLKRSGYVIRENVAADAHGSAVVVHTGQGYDLALRRNEEGAYEVFAQWPRQPGRAQVRQVRADVEARIKQKYAYEKVKRELARKGFIVSSEEVQPDNAIRLVARKW